MNTFKHILVATDFEEAAERVFATAAGLATKLDAEITLAHVYDVPMGVYAEGLAWPIDELKDAAKRALDLALAKAKAVYPKTDAVLGTGAPAEVILRIAKERGADVIVMGTHGRRGLSRALMGSVAERVVRMSPIPVLTVPVRDERAS